MPNNSKRKADDAELDNVTDWSKLKVSELRNELEARGLDTAGKKAELIERLEDNEAEEARTSSSKTKAKTPEVLSAKPAKKSSKPEKVKKTGWAAMSAPALKDECREREISTGGSKADLVARLEDDDAEKALVNDPSYVPRRDENSIATGEKRMHAFQPRPDNDFKERCKKAKTERMIMLNRSKGKDNNGVINETFDIAGSSGSMYVTTIGCVYKCNCMDFAFRKLRCKHIIYALVIILKAPVELASQLALLSSEVKEIFENAPVTVALSFGTQEHAHPGKRKPIDGDCPICVTELEEDEDLLWCKAACGQNVHRTCFEEWKKVKSANNLTCVYCRSKWIEGGNNEGLDALKEAAPKIGSYKNIAHLDIYKNAPVASQD